MVKGLGVIDEYNPDKPELGEAYELWDLQSTIYRMRAAQKCSRVMRLGHLN